MTMTRTVTHREAFLEDVARERADQDAEWGASYDKNHTINDWCALICHHASSTVVDAESQYEAMKIVAALATACAERIMAGDGPAPRHYDEV